jgi:HSP20 family protein
MAQVDVKQGNQTGNQTGNPGQQSSQSGATGQTREQSNAGMQRSQESESGRQGLASTRGRSGSGLSRETGGFGWPSRSLSAIDLWSASPFELMRRMSNEMDRVLQALPTPGIAAGGLFIPPVEIVHQQGKLIITADLPGLSPEDVRVEATDEGLVIEGERTNEHEETSGGVYRSERIYGAFRRVIPLPEDAQVAQAKARFENGVLEVTVPLSEENARRRQIPISGSEGEAKASSTTPNQQEATTQSRR